jgi:DNA (cytosine-5)-methyltransferase 1
VTPRLLDLFCGAGGASVGYQRAGFVVIGVDHEYHKTYPYGQIVDDALHVLTDRAFLDLFDVIHASPPCQENTRAQHLRDAQGRRLGEHGGDLLGPVRDALVEWGGIYVLENVPGAPMRPDVLLCGSSFGLKVRRHRWFESNAQLGLIPPCVHGSQGRPVGVYGSLNDDIPDGGRTARTLAEASEAMGIDWMRWADLKEALPPVYTQYIGQQLVAILDAAA